MRESRESDAVIATMDDAEITTEPLDLECRKNMMLANLEAGVLFQHTLGSGPCEVEKCPILEFHA